MAGGMPCCGRDSDSVSHFDTLCFVRPGTFLLGGV